jgi:ribose transport system permease protein
MSAHVGETGATFDEGVAKIDAPRQSADERSRSVLTTIGHGAADVTRRPLFVVATALIGLVVAFTFVNGTKFVSVDNLRNMALAGGINLILAVGITYVIITAGFDLSVGSVLVFAGVVSVKVMVSFGGNGWGTAFVGLLVALAAGAAWGAVNGMLVAYAELNPIIVTLGSLGAALGLAQVIADGQDLNAIPSVMLNFGIDRIFGVPRMVVVALFVALIFGIVLRLTIFGRHTYAIGSSKEASKRAGLHVSRHLTFVYALSGFLAGLAGWLSLSVYGTTNMSGHSLDNLNAATAALLGGVSLYGGVGTVLGATLGTLIPVVLASGLVIAGLQSFWQQAVTGVVLVAAVFLDRLRRPDRARRRRRTRDG